jgi:DNA-binding XRE family transcriptional regulator
MKTKVTYLDPKRVLVETLQGDKFIIGFHSEMNYQWEQQANIPFTDFLASLFDKYYKGDDMVIMGEITRQLMLNCFESVFSFQRDPIQNRVIMGNRIREIREKKGMDIMTLAFKSNIQPNTLKRIEAGKYSADLDILAQIAQSMEMKIDFVELRNDESHEDQ